MITPIAEEDTKKLEDSNFAGGNVKWNSNSGNSLTVPFKTKNRFNKQPRYALLDTYLREMKTISFGNLYMNVHSSFIHNSLQMETIQIALKG